MLIGEIRYKSINLNSHVFRYQCDWLLQCLLLKIKSPKAYRFLRENGVLPLPHESSLQRLVRGLPCQFGFTDFVFDTLGNLLKTKSERDRHGVLVFDEIKVRESLNFDKVSMKFNGFVDFGEFTDEYFQKTRKVNRLADHALVFMFRSLNSNLVS